MSPRRSRSVRSVAAIAADWRSPTRGRASVQRRSRRRPSAPQLARAMSSRRERTPPRFQHAGHGAALAAPQRPTARARSSSMASKSARQTWNPCHGPPASPPKASNRRGPPHSIHNPAWRAPMTSGRRSATPSCASSGSIPGCRGLAGTVAAGWLALAQHDAETARRAGDRGGAARGAAADDDYVGIERSIVHGPFSRWISTVLSET